MAHWGAQGYCRLLCVSPASVVQSPAVTALLPEGSLFCPVYVFLSSPPTFSSRHTIAHLFCRHFRKTCVSLTARVPAEKEGQMWDSRSLQGTLSWGQVLPPAS